MKKKRLLSLTVLISLLIITPILLKNFLPNTRKLSAVEKQEQVVLFITRLYNTCLNREPEAAGLDFWTNALLTQKISGADIAEFFYTQEEFQNLNLTDDQFLDQLYLTFMNRPADNEGRSFWQNCLNNGCRREGVLRSFLASKEYADICRAAELEVGEIPAREARDENLHLTMFVHRLYQKVLERNSDVRGLNHWIECIIKGESTPAEAAANFFFSEEFEQKNHTDSTYLQILYRAMLDRTPDESGFQTWLDTLSTGTSRKTIFDEFAASDEFMSICASYGLGGDSTSITNSIIVPVPTPTQDSTISTTTPESNASNTSAPTASDTNSTNTLAPTVPETNSTNAPTPTTPTVNSSNTSPTPTSPTSNSANKPTTPTSPASSAPSTSTAPAPTTPEANPETGTTPSSKVPKTAEELVQKINIGWNLGNALDSIDFQKRGNNSSINGKPAWQYYETLWKNPITSNAMIKTVADAGFEAVRLPVTWYDHMDANYVINDAWMQRVKEVVDYIIQNDMYCIINLHHDAGSGTWLKADLNTLAENKIGLEKVWMQIAAAFANYDERLIFEGFNEIVDSQTNWSSTTAAAYDAVNQLNQLFVDTIRKAGGYNPRRFLIVKTYASGVVEEMLSGFKLPKDSIQDHLIVGIHSYAPLAFAWPQDELFWTTSHSDWRASDIVEVKDIIDRVSTHFTSKGIPVMMTEFGAWNKQNTQDRIAYANYQIRYAKEHGITCFWWDNGGNFDNARSVDSFALLNRYKNEWFFPEIVQAMVQTANNTRSQMNR